MSELVTFIDNAEDRMVIEYDAGYFEETFSTGLGEIDVDKVKRHLGIHVGWSCKGLQYLGQSYIVTFERMWV